MDRELMKPVCRLCDQPYNGDVMYIRCEACKNWFHADALELDESKIFSVVGYKCCKCRRIKSPVCPYSNLQKKNVLKGKIDYQQASKLKIPAMSFNRDMILAHHEEVPTSSKLPNNPEVIHVSAAAANNPLLPSLYEAKQCTEGKSEGNSGWENANASDHEPRKLPVRRHSNREMDAYCPEGAYHFEATLPFEANVVNSTQEMTTRKVTKLATNSFRDEVTNHTEVNPVIPVQDFYDLEPDVGSYVNSKGPSSVPRNGVPEVFHDPETLIGSAETSNQIVPCKLCSKTEPWTDLSCEICGIKIHRTCSPWYESSCNEDEDGWRCGSCRDWS